MADHPSRIASSPEDEERARVVELRGYGILDTANEPIFDQLVRDAADSCEAPIALISLIDEHRQWFKARLGLEPQETPRAISFCTHAISGSEVFEIADATADDRFTSNPLVTGDPNIRFYAGAPLKTPSGRRIGTLCVIDNKPRSRLSQQARGELEALAERTMEAFEARAAGLRLEKS